MAIRAPINLTDAAAVPVVHVFDPAETKDGVLIFVDRLNPVFIGQNRLSTVQRLATRQTKASKMSWKLETPILEQTSPSTSTGIQPAPTVAYTPLFQMDFVLPDRCTLQERKNLLAMARDLIDEAIVTNQVLDFNVIY